MQNWSDPELRHEVRTLKAMVRSLLRQEAETRVKHNMLLEKTYKEFKSVHEKKVVADNQFLQVGEHLTGVSQKMAEMQGGLNTLFEQMGLAKQAFDHSDNLRNAKAVEQLEAFTLMKEDLERFKFDVQAEAHYVETTYVPQALEAIQQRVEVQVKDVRGHIEAAQVVYQDQVGAIANKVIEEAKGYIGIQVSEAKTEMMQGAMQGGAYEPVRCHLANLGIQQEGIMHEMIDKERVKRERDILEEFDPVSSAKTPTIPENPGSLRSIGGPLGVKTSLSRYHSHFGTTRTQYVVACESACRCL
jgi:hypothetical protein